MSYALQDAVWKIRGIRGVAKLVLLRLAHYPDDASKPSFPSIKTLAEWTGLSPRTVVSALQELERAGLIVAAGGRSLGGPKKTNRWLLVLATVQELQSCEPVQPCKPCTVEPLTLQISSDNRAGFAEDSINEEREDSLAGAKEGDARAGAPPAPVPTASVAEPPKEAKGSRWPSGQTVPQDWIAEGYAVRTKAGLPEIDLDLEAANFADHWAAASGSNATKRDWRAAWRVWARKSYQKPLGTGVTINGNASHAHSSAGRTDFFAANFIRTAGILRN